GRDGLVVEFLLLGVRDKNHDDVGPSSGIGGRFHGEAVFFGFAAGSAGFGQADAHVAAAVAQIKRVGVALRTVTEDRNLFRLDEGEVGVFIVIEFRHVIPFVGRFAAVKTVSRRTDKNR